MVYLYVHAGASFLALFVQTCFLMVGILQILTDAALLKRQQLEIEELRKKLEVIRLLMIILTFKSENLN